MNRYNTIPQIVLEGKKVYQTTRYPEIALSENDIFVISSKGDRFDILANQYYNDQSLWWIISIANTSIVGTSLSSDLPQNSLIIPEGIQIRIPFNYSNILNSFKILNNI